MALFANRPSFSRLILPAIAVIGLLVAGVLIAQGQPERTLEDPAELPARAPKELANRDRAAGTGLVEPSSETIDIGAALSGLVTAVLVTPGEQVTRGQPLFRLDDRAARARVAEAEANIRQAAAGIAEARTAASTAARQLALYRRIDDPLAVSRVEVIRAEGEAAAASSRLNLAQAQLGSASAARDSARTELARLTVTAPITGEVLRVDVRPGEFVQAGGPQGSSASIYMQMGQTTPLHLRIDIDEDDAGRVNQGAPAIVTPRGAPGDRVEAAFVRAEPLITPKRSLTNSATERVDVRVLQLIYRLPDGEKRFRVGQQVDAFIPARAAVSGKR